ncbi:hypothetical protein GCM10009021_16210 [Halarchaeum nitratireducens]|uniref:C2H2-type domain-containing protein n=1 Tax=Halarchaeum nitratireducens TaxID=489913 RepID=A0A830GBP1_9EURY|nr:hypothetical protein GCM10009021_16210 [Halarchaeum nitratireducens]
MTTVGKTPNRTGVESESMVEETQRDDMTWYRCEKCGLMFDSEDDATQHEETCDAEDPSYLQ